MLKKILIGLSIILAILVAIFFFPQFSPSYREIYRDVDKNTRLSLQSFRTNYPTSRLDVEGTTWEYLSLGQGKETILFLHGMTGSYDIWWQQILEFKENYKIISLGYPPVNSLQETAEGILAIMKKEQTDSVYVVGSSLGGLIVQYLLANYPQIIKKAILANTFSPNLDKNEKNRKAGRFLPIIPEWLLMKMLRNQTQAEIFPAAGHSELVKAFIFEQAYGRMRKKHFQARFHCVIDLFERPDIEELNIPVLILESDNDPLISAEDRKILKKSYPTAKVRTLNNAGHFPYLNAPKLYSNIMHSFFSS